MRCLRSACACENVVMGRFQGEIPRQIHVLLLLYGKSELVLLKLKKYVQISSKLLVNLLAKMIVTRKNFFLIFHFQPRDRGKGLCCTRKYINDRGLFCHTR